MFSTEEALVRPMSRPTGAAMGPTGLKALLAPDMTAEHDSNGLQQWLNASPIGR
jgi:hypothetical protein